MGAKANVLTRPQIFKLFKLMEEDCEYLETTRDSYGEIADRFSKKCGFPVGTGAIKDGWRSIEGLSPKKPTSHRNGGGIFPGAASVVNKQTRCDIATVAKVVVAMCNRLGMNNQMHEVLEVVDRGVGTPRRSQE